MEKMEDIVRRIAQGGRYQQLTSGADTHYRVWSTGGTTIVKIYGNDGRYRREQHAIDALGGIDGVPEVLDRGNEGEYWWAQFVDGGKWSLQTMPENMTSARKAGAILRRLHEADPGLLTNLAGGIDEYWLRSEFATVFERLRRYRRRLNLPAELIDGALAAPPPIASEPRAAHTRPTPAKFLVADDGRVTLINWGWATLAPPEWDYSLAVWMTSLDVGVHAGEALTEGYGRMMSDDAMRSWVAYHAGSYLLTQAETRDGPLADLAYMVDQLAVMVE